MTWNSNYEHLVRMTQILGWRIVENGEGQMLRFVHESGGEDAWLVLSYSMDHFQMVENLARATLQILGVED